MTPPRRRATAASALLLFALLLLACLPRAAGSRPEPPAPKLAESYPPDPATGLSAIPGCELVPTPWADGDSFRVKARGGEQFTVRLYGVDCIERHVADETDARRLRGQRRYFGIAGGAVPESIARAKQLAERAAEATARRLAEPFTVFTAFADGRGDARFPRVYGFVRLADGRDLGEWLVAHGHARAFGVTRRTPDGSAKEEYAARLADIELSAAKRGEGAWAKTDWGKLLPERAAQREEEAELRLASGDGPPPEEPLDVNTASREELMRVPGIGEITANRIIEARPFGSVEDLLRVPGIGPATFEKLRPFFAVPAGHPGR